MWKNEGNSRPDPPSSTKREFCDAECEVQIACEGDLTDSSEGIEENKNGVDVCYGFKIICWTISLWTFFAEIPNGYSSFLYASLLYLEQTSDDKDKR